MAQLLFDTVWTGWNFWWLPVVSMAALFFLRCIYKKRTMEEK